MRKIIVATALSVACSAALLAVPYEVDVGHSSVGFSVKHLSVSNVNGGFDKFNGTLDVEGKIIKALSGEVEIASINTNSDSRDKHLNTPDFFDSKKFGKATLELVKHNGNKLEANITMRGITKKVVFDVELNGPITHPKTGKNIVALTLQGKLNRKDFGVGTDTGNAIVGDNVDVYIELEAIQQ